MNKQQQHKCEKSVLECSKERLTFEPSSYVKELLLRLNQVFELLDFSLQFVHLVFVGLPGNDIGAVQRR